MTQVPLWAITLLQKKKLKIKTCHKCYEVNDDYSSISLISWEIVMFLGTSWQLKTSWCCWCWRGAGGLAECTVDNVASREQATTPPPLLLLLPGAQERLSVKATSRSQEVRLNHPVSCHLNTNRRRVLGYQATVAHGRRWKHVRLPRPRAHGCPQADGGLHPQWEKKTYKPNISDVTPILPCP